MKSSCSADIALVGNQSIKLNPLKRRTQNISNRITSLIYNLVVCKREAQEKQMIAWPLPSDVVKLIQLKRILCQHRFIAPWPTLIIVPI